MTNLVFLEPNNVNAIPFTTSDIIAEFAKINYRSVQRTIENQINRLERFGRVRIEITPFETKGGTQNKKIYYLNEQQATLLITFLKNNDIVADFKTELVRQFYEMREELQGRRDNRGQLNPVRRELTDVIQALGISPWFYKIYTDLAYKSALGKSAAQIRLERGAGKKAKAIDYMTASEISAVTKAEYRISMLLEMGMDYQQVKNILLNIKCINNVA